ncbi:4Fe-4S ferredoxin N-terminal domain-containing protein [Halosolutus gelatinilyticus]|uniref:4Fe-4S ferredoxin N-terminal domain-containing protein n=1 Tax=Halosolutus gelatinilyticus TaxID=2931975 RepID=UPI001FF189CC|nr:4Fe-4S ferredoxin N-terminal domain-containing protein [Halosolutus gelatinilyticus]
MGDKEDETVDEAFHPLGEGWQNELEGALEETEYDAELGLEMAEDAMKVTKGELSEAEFYDRYHDDVVEEFGEDDRPIERPDDGNRLEGTLSRLGVDEESRRDVMKKLGAGAGAVGLGAWGTTADDGQPSVAAVEEEGDGNVEGTQYGMAIDLEQCDACLSCVVACAEEHNWEQGANWMYVLDYEDTTPGGKKRLVRPCQHCTDAPCEKVCPTTARHTRESDGLVLTDYDICIGCRYCQVACPYGVNYFQWEEPSVPVEELEEDHMYDARGRWVGARGPRGVMEKCTFCATRQDGSKGEEFVGRTACEDACPPEAIQFGDMNDPESDPQRYLEDPALARVQARNPQGEELQQAIDILTGEAEPAQSGGDGMTEQEARELIQAEAGETESTFKLQEDIGTNPNVVYIGNEPGPNAEQVEGPVTYAEVGQTNNRIDALEERTIRAEADPFE